MNTSDSISILTAIIAAAAFLLSVYNFYVHRRDRQLPLKVWISRGTNTVNDKTKSTKSATPVLFIEASNPSDRRVVITSADVYIKKHKIELVAQNFKEDALQAELLPGDNAIFMFPIATLGTSLRKQNITKKVKVKARVHDTLRNTYYSRNFIVLMPDEVLP